MTRLTCSLALLWLAVAPLAHAETALSALRALPKGEAGRVVSMEGTDGLGEPQQWRIAVRDTKGQKRLREYVVAAGEVVTSGEVEQQEEGARSATFSRSEVKIDSNQAAALARNEAGGANAAAGVRLQLQKQSPKAVPVWMATCVDENGRDAGLVAVTASKGKVVGREGFELRPGPATEEGGAPSVDRRVIESDRSFLAEVEPADGNRVKSVPPADTPGAEAANAPASAASTPLTPENRPEQAAIEPVESREGRAIGQMQPRESAGVANSTPEAPGEKSPGKQKERTRRSNEISISPVREAARVTRPVRQIIHRVLPF